LAGVRVVAVRASHRTETERVTAGLESICTGTLMAGKAYFLLRYFIHDRIPRSMHFMTTRAGYFLFLVYAASPVDHVAVIVTGHADFILFGRGIAFVECNGRRRAGSILVPLAMRSAWTVTGFAIVIAVSEG
jgi:hypothetical protein